MKLKTDENRTQPDPFIFEDGGRFYIYVTAINGVEAYSASDIFGEWTYEGVVTAFGRGKSFWAPSVIKINGAYYMYVSCDRDGEFEYMYVACADSPLGPFKNEKRLYGEFSIDSHMVKTSAGLFLWLAMDNRNTDKIGTRIFVDRFSDPYTPENKPVEAVVPDFDEEIYMRNRFGDGKDWYTLEGPFWLRKGDWQYLIYSGACFENDTYHLGYASCKYESDDLTKAKLVKHTENGKFAPLLFKNEAEEGTGHNSVIEYKGEYYCIYHGRDVDGAANGDSPERRTARICRLEIKDGIITAERM